MRQRRVWASSMTIGVQAHLLRFRVPRGPAIGPGPARARLPKAGDVEAAVRVGRRARRLPGPRRGGQGVRTAQRGVGTSSVLAIEACNSVGTRAAIMCGSPDPGGSKAQILCEGRADLVHVSFVSTSHRIQEGIVAIRSVPECWESCLSVLLCLGLLAQLDAFVVYASRACFLAIWTLFCDRL